MDVKVAGGSMALHGHPQPYSRGEMSCDVGGEYAVFQILLLLFGR
jgi:hypothetical protein